MFIIGLTGGIGTGKSTVAGILKELGAVVIDSDQVAREIVKPGANVLQDIVRCFGSEMLLPDGSLNRKALGALVFTDQNKRKLLNQITHPAIKDRIAALLQQLEKTNPGAVVVIEAPLLFEAGMVSMVDEVWLVMVESHIQLKRVMERDNLDYQAALMRIESQMTPGEMSEYSHVIISTDLHLAEVRRKVEREWQRINNILEGSGG